MSTNFTTPKQHEDMPPVESLSEVSLADELSILELDDRLEFVNWCDTNCVCS